MSLIPRSIIVVSFLSIIMIISPPNISTAQITLNKMTGPTQLVISLLGPGVNYSNIQFTGCNACRGKFNGIASNIGIDQGIVLATGDISIAQGPNNDQGKFSGIKDDPRTNKPGGQGEPGDPDLTTMLGGTNTFDAAVLEFDFIAPGTELIIPYVFASEEYPEFVCSDANDIFAIYISGAGISGTQNMAKLPGTNVDVTINSVNSGDNSNAACKEPDTPPCATNCALGNSAYYIGNGDGSTPTNNQQVQYDGLTALMEAKATLICGETYHIKIAIADAWDGVWDSGLFLKEGIFNNVTGTVIKPDLGDDITVCSSQPITLNPGPEQNGVDYLWSNGETTPTISIAKAGTYWVEISNGLCSQKDEITITMNSMEVTSSFNLDGDCDRFGGTVATSSVAPQGGSAPYSYLWDDPQKQTTPTAIGLSPGTYNVSVSDSKGCSSNSTITIPNKIQISLNVDNDPCSSCNDGSITATVGGSGKHPLKYRWDDEGEQTTSTASGLKTGTYILTVTDAEGCYTSDTIQIGITGIYNYQPEPLELFPNPSNGSFTINLPKSHSGSLIIYNSIGSIIKLEEVKNTNRINIKLLDITKGVYFVTFTTEESIFSNSIFISE